MLLGNAFDPDVRVYSEARSLLAAGYSVRILAWDRDCTLPPAEVVDGIEVERIRVRSTHGRGAAQAYYTGLVSLAMIARARRRSFDVIHAHDMDMLPAGYLLSIRMHKPLIYDSHEDYAGMLHGTIPGWMENAIRRLEDFLVRRIDLLITVVWVAYAVVFFGTIAIRKVRHIYVANWFFGAFIIAVALLHIVNNIQIPTSLTHSYSVYAGVQDAMVQWWYGHNAVGFFLTAGFLGMMYYYIPKQAERPVYSYRLSIVHFWALIFTYMWAGPHHLHYTALPDWAQSVGMVFSLVLLAPSWGGMINGMMTLSGAWHKLRDDPILKFLIVSLSFYGMATFEGPMMSIKTVNALSHYTDWTVGHVHAGALGWVGFITMGSLYYLIPRMFGQTKMYSTRLIELHFWIATAGVVLYIASMWIAGVMQGLMWRAVNADGTLVYSFAEGVKATWPFYVVRLTGGGLYLAGMLIMAFNVVRTMAQGRPQTVRIPLSMAQA